MVRSHGVVSRGLGSAKTAQVRLRKDGLGVSSVVVGKVPAAPTMPCGRRLAMSIYFLATLL